MLWKEAFVQLYISLIWMFTYPEYNVTCGKVTNEKNDFFFKKRERLKKVPGLDWSDIGDI